MDVRHFEQLRDVCMNMNTITDILNDFPHIGYKPMTSFLRARGLAVRQSRIRRTIPEGTFLRALRIRVIYHIIKKRLHHGDDDPGPHNLNGTLKVFEYFVA